LRPRKLPRSGAFVNKSTCCLVALLLGLLSGCGEFKEYTYRDYPMGREQVYDGILNILRDEGYEVADQTENVVNDLPELEIETEWNMRDANGIYRGNDRRRRAYVKIITLYSERKPNEYQPLSPNDGKKIREMQEEQRKKADLEHTRLGIAVTLERRDAIDRPLEAEWIYEGPDSQASAQLLGRFEALFGKMRQGGASRPSTKGERLAEERARLNQNNR